MRFAPRRRNIDRMSGNPDALVDGNLVANESDLDPSVASSAARRRNLNGAIDPDELTGREVDPRNRPASERNR